MFASGATISAVTGSPAGAVMPAAAIV